MPTLETSTLEDKARELCQHIADSPEFTDAHRKLGAFMQDDEAKAIYGSWQEMDHRFHMMSHDGQKPSDADLEEFGKLKAAVEANPVAADFALAEAHLNGVFGTVTKMLQKTLQTGSVPTAEDLSECCNESGCGCG